jgi:hypothetical protein
MVLDRHVPAFDVAGFVEAFAERGRVPRGGIGRPDSDKADHRQRRLLRARSERKRKCGAAEQADELAPSNIDCHLIRPQWGHAAYNVGNNITPLIGGL